MACVNGKVFVGLDADCVPDESPSIEDVLEQQGHMHRMTVYIGQLRPAWRKAILAWLSGQRDASSKGKTDQHRALLALRVKFALFRTR